MRIALLCMSIISVGHNNFGGAKENTYFTIADDT